MAAARSVMLKYLRVPVVQGVQPNPSVATTLFNAVRARFYSEDVRGTFLDKSEVTDRIITVVKNFQKVDPSKVCSSLLQPPPLFLLS